eukprot:m.103651 g.103651  ORF g.103651 m.103651 type:complete len:154 (+) comp13817_c0_seq16:124-585(+)
MALGYWQRNPGHQKFFVEPIPSIFEKLKANMEGVPNVTLLNKAVRSPDLSAKLDLYCWDFDLIKRAVEEGELPFPSEVRQPALFWAYICSLDREDVIVSTNTYETDAFKAAPEDRKMAIKKEIEVWVVYITGIILFFSASMIYDRCGNTLWRL